MSEYALSAMSLGILHAFVLLVPAWLLCRRSAPFRIGRASRLVRSVTAVVFALLFAAFLPIPEYTVSGFRTVKCWAMSRQQGTRQEAAAESEVAFAGALKRVRWQANGTNAAEHLVHSSKAQLSISEWVRASLPRLFQVALLVSAFLCVRQLIGLLSLSWLRRTSIGIEDSRCLATLEALAQQLDCRNVELRSTKMLSAAATAGWFRPVILLPQDFRDWSPQELRAALAHELAHVNHRDFAWRLLSGWYAAIHCCNPLAHWLHRRLVLEQELSADRTACQLLGDSQVYSRALYRLAMRAEDAKPSVCIPGLLSVTSTNLIRRIEMLRAKEGSTQTMDGRKRFAGVILLAVVATLATGLRVSADMPKHSARKASGHVARDFDVSQLPSSKQGAFVLRLSELFGDSMRPYGPAIRKLVTSELASMGITGISLEKIESVGGNLNMRLVHTGKTLEPGDEGHEHSLILSVDGMIIRLRAAQDMQTRINKLFPDAELIDESKQIYLLRPIAALGPYQLRVKIVDDQNIAISFTPDGHKWIVDHPEPASEQPSWEDSWKAIDSGAVTVLFDESKIKWPRTFETWPKEVQNVLTEIDVFGFGFSPGQPMNLSAAVTTKGKVSAKLVQNLLGALKKLATNPERQFLAEWVENLDVTLADRQMRFRGPIVFPKVGSGSEINPVAAQNPNSKESIQLHAKLVRFEIEKLQALEVDYLMADEIAKNESGIYSTSEVGHSLALHLNRNPKASLALIKRLREEGLCETLAEPLMITNSDEPCVCAWGENSLRFAPKLQSKENLVAANLKLEGRVDHQTDIVARPGVTYFLPVPSKAGDKASQYVLVFRTELLADPSDVLQTAQKLGDGTDR